MRSKIADYRVIEVVPPANDGARRYLCRPPERLGADEEPVLVTEISVDAAGWRPLTDLLVRLASAGSAHLVRLLEVGPDPDAGGGLYLASEASAGGGVADPATPLDGPGRLRALADAARGAHGMHEVGVAHGAIGPGSIVMSERGALLAPPPLGGPPGLVLRAGGWKDVVTVYPGLLRGEEPSRASDVWSLAATLHGLLSDRPLYRGMESDPPVTAIQRVIFARPDVDPSLPAGVAATIASCLESDPALRPATAAELADRLDATEMGG